ncbi:hypothetical protein RhiJN_17028 [Ceratobasidium sp. AG-Ba]|nr:hypothetical protein RhiJN_17028 [Ceratobasidium sp. AG-Ba]
MLLEYPVTKEYSIRNLTIYFSVFSIIAITGLVILNVILQGYQVVSVLKSDPNITERHWWSTGAMSIRSTGKCNPVSLPRKSTITTNSSLFSYEIHQILDTDNQSSANSASYTANLLRNCTVDAIIANINSNDWSSKFETHIFCTGSDLKFSLLLVSKLSLNYGNRYLDDFFYHYTQSRISPTSFNRSEQPLIERNASSLLNIIAVLDAISADFYGAVLLIRNSQPSSPMNVISIGGWLACPGGRNTTCEPEEMRMMIPECGISYPNGTSEHMLGKICSTLALVEAEFLNMFTVLHDAYHIDLGNIQPSNVLLSMEAFSSRIHISPGISMATQIYPEERICTWGLGCINGSSWANKLLASNPDIRAVIPSILPAGNASAVFKVDYLCPHLVLKSTGSLITSVFIGTWAMYAALLGLFGVIGPKLEKRYGTGRDIIANTKGPTSYAELKT